MNFSTKKLIRSVCLHKVIFPVSLILFLVFNAEAGRIIGQPNQGYWLGVPSVISSDKASPVLICLPGWGVSAAKDINVWSFPAEKKGLLLVDLDVNYATSSVAQIYEKIQRIINQLSADYNIDRDTTFIAGTSAGGIMAISLALVYPGRFKAIAVISGARLNREALRRLDNASGQKFYFAHGAQDESIPISEFYDTKDKLQTNGAVIEFKVISEGRHTLPTGNYKDAVDWLYQFKDRD